MKRCNPLLDPSKEKLTYGPIWVRLPGFHLEFWSDDIFRLIGDKLGSFVDADRSYEVSGRLTVARIMVNLDSSDDLSAELNMVYGDYSHIQILDYEGLHFRCHNYHKVCHVLRDFPLFLPRSVGRKIQREKTIGRNKEKKPEGSVLRNQEKIPKGLVQKSLLWITSRMCPKPTPMEEDRRLRIDGKHAPGWDHPIFRWKGTLLQMSTINSL